MTFDANAIFEDELSGRGLAFVKESHDEYRISLDALELIRSRRKFCEFPTTASKRSDASNPPPDERARCASHGFTISAKALGSRVFSTSREAMPARRAMPTP